MASTTAAIPEESIRSNTVAWPLAARVAFRFAFIYWIVYVLPTRGASSVLDLLPWYPAWLVTIFSWPLSHIALWAGTHLFHLSGVAGTWHVTGSGDTALNYISVLCIAIFAALGTLIWSVIGESRGRRLEHRTCFAWLLLLLRFTLAATMFSYGVAKLFNGQFGPPSLSTLTENYGDASPMGLLWTFMGASRAYTIFTGLAETGAGVLLLFRRTSTLGALLGAAAMLNIVLLNFCYDVPVKLYSTHLLVMGLFLLLPDLAPLGNFFLLRKPAVLTGLWVRRSERAALRWGSRVLMALVLFGLLYSLWTTAHAPNFFEPRPPLYGIWTVDTVSGQPDSQHWAKLTMEYPGMMRIDQTDHKVIYPQAAYDRAAQTLTITQRDKSAGGKFHWTMDSGLHTATLTGVWAGQPVTLTMHKTNPDTFKLQTRGFHWIQEYPFNR